MLRRETGYDLVGVVVEVARAVGRALGRCIHESRWAYPALVPAAARRDSVESRDNGPGVILARFGHNRQGRLPLVAGQSRRRRLCYFARWH
jgi:hypothetical protein